MEIYCLHVACGLRRAVANEVVQIGMLRRFTKIFWPLMVLYLLRFVALSYVLPGGVE